jgi:hypothetical protein
MTSATLALMSGIVLATLAGAGWAATVVEPPPAPKRSVVETEPVPKRACLSQSETREVVAARKLFAPFSALRTAAARGHGETIGVRLCRLNEELIYEVTVLRRDGRVVKVVIDAVSGKIVRILNDR